MALIIPLLFTVGLLFKVLISHEHDHVCPIRDIVYIHKALLDILPSNNIIPVLGITDSGDGDDF
jgi:hypothetical protein